MVLYFKAVFAPTLPWTDFFCWTSIHQPVGIDAKRIQVNIVVAVQHGFLLF